MQLRIIKQLILCSECYTVHTLGSVIDFSMIQPDLIV